ncbi:hypothetical protein MACH07_02700 [Flagellimonas marinaquae]|uniref:Uncharacterized protein n=1 Tax=Flagellimonas marinaquae TaxID=254955 RepID=A0AA48HFT7_9FLAO|nr:hypothetical protein MACH07_02700 [Allomuricauda aquimarina]
MLVVNFVRSANTSRIPIIGVSKYFEALVYKNIVDHKISDAIGKYSKTQWPAVPERRIAAQIK